MNGDTVSEEGGTRIIRILIWNMEGAAGGSKNGKHPVALKILRALVDKYPSDFVLINENANHHPKPAQYFIEKAADLLPVKCRLHKGEQPPGHEYKSQCLLYLGERKLPDPTPYSRQEFPTKFWPTNCKKVPNNKRPYNMLRMWLHDEGINLHFVHIDSDAWSLQKIVLLNVLEGVHDLGPDELRTPLPFIAIGDWNDGLEYAKFPKGRYAQVLREGLMHSKDVQPELRMGRQIEITTVGGKEEVSCETQVPFPPYTRIDEKGWTDFFVSNIKGLKCTLTHFTFGPSITGQGKLSDHMPVHCEFHVPVSKDGTPKCVHVTRPLDWGDPIDPAGKR